MAFTADDLARIRAAIARGEKTVQFSDRSVTYRSMDELFAAEEKIAQALANRPRQSLAFSEKGF